MIFRLLPWSFSLDEIYRIIHVAYRKHGSELRLFLLLQIRADANMAQITPQIGTEHHLINLLAHFK